MTRALYHMGSHSTVQNHPGLCPHPPSPDGRRGTKPDPPSRSSDSVEGRRCLPTLPPAPSTRNPDILPTYLFLPPDRRLLDQAGASFFPQLPAKPAGGSTTTAALERWHPTPRPTTQSDPIVSQTPDNPLPSVRPAAHQSVIHPQSPHARAFHSTTHTLLAVVKAVIQLPRRRDILG